MLLELTTLNDEKILVPVEQSLFIENKNGFVSVNYHGIIFNLKESMQEIIFLISPEQELEFKRKNKML